MLKKTSRETNNIWYKCVLNLQVHKKERKKQSQCTKSSKRHKTAAILQIKVICDPDV